MGLLARSFGRDLSVERPMVMAVGLAIAGIVLVVLALPIFVRSAGWAYDFAAYFVAAVRTSHGLSPYPSATLAGPFTNGPPWYVYAPILSTLLIPLAVLPLQTASLVWLGLSLALTALACAILPVRPWIRVAALGVTLLSVGYLSNLNLGSVNALLLCCLALAWRWRSSLPAGVAMALSLSIRPYLATVLLAWALWRRWRALAWVLVCGLGLTIGVGLVAGVGAFTDFLTVLANVRFGGAPHNGALVGVAEALGASSPVLLAATAIALGVAVAAILLARRVGDPDLTFAVAVGASLLASPVIWDHYLILLVIPGAFLAQRGRWWGLALPLLAWLPWPVYPLVAALGTFAPFATAWRPPTRVAAAPLDISPVPPR